MGFYEDFFRWTQDQPDRHDTSPYDPLYHPVYAPLIKFDALSDRPSETSFEAVTREFIEDPADVDRVFRDIEDVAGRDPYLALAQASALCAVVSHASRKDGHLTTRLTDVIPRFKGILAKVKAEAEAVSYTISIGLPLGISIGITFQ